jgi:hypothetical protein
LLFIFKVSAAAHFRNGEDFFRKVSRHAGARAPLRKYPPDSEHILLSRRAVIPSLRDAIIPTKVMMLRGFRLFHQEPVEIAQFLIDLRRIGNRAGHLRPQRLAIALTQP